MLDRELVDLRPEFRGFLEAHPGRLHFAAHSHHLWPDVTSSAHQQAWLDAAKFADDKWDHVFSEVVPAAQRWVAAELRLPSDGGTLVFAPNTHELVLRLLSCLPEKPRVVTSDSEFHSAERQLRRLEEDGLVSVERVPAEPASTFGERLVTAARRGRTDLVFFSHVFFNSGAVVGALDRVIEGLPANAMVVVDGYHGFCAVPTDLSIVQGRAFYLAGGYKYAMAGEGACFLHVPAWADGLRPRNTGWFAAFGALEERVAGRVPYAAGAARFWGATFDPSGLYRLNAAMDWRQRVGWTTVVARKYVHELQRRFVDGLPSSGPVRRDELVVPIDVADRGQFLTFRAPKARAISAALARENVVTDARDDRLRFGFGPYITQAELSEGLARLGRVKVAP